MASLASLSSLGAAGLAQLYGLVQSTRHALYQKRVLKTHPSPLPTLSVGGLEVGGVGKTPVVSLLLRAFVAAGVQPGLLTRGFRRRRRGLVVRPQGAAVDWTAVGDEAAMLVAQGHDIAVAACAQRLTGAEALTSLGTQLAVMDDGFAHRALSRQLDIVVLQGERPLGDGRLLPWGCLREMPKALERADLVWLHFRAPPADGQRQAAARAALPKALEHKPIVVSEAWPAPAKDHAGKAVRLAGRAVLGVAAIARPDEFRRALMARGAQVVAFVPLDDHHCFTPTEAQALLALAYDQGAAVVATTPKDYVKLAPLWPKDELPLCQAGLRVDLVCGHAVLARTIHERLGLPVRLPAAPSIASEE